VAGEATAKNDLLNRLSRVEGQVRGIAKMVEQDKYCIDILIAVAAACHALQSVAMRRVDCQLNHCVVDATGVDGPGQEAKLTEVSNAIARLIRI